MDTKPVQDLTGITSDQGRGGVADQESSSAGTERPTVLVVEDEQKTLASIVEGLGLEGWSIRAAMDGNEALGLVSAQPFDLLILDWMLPGLSGLALLKQLRSSGHQVPVLMLTVRDAVTDRVSGLEAGADDYLTKPFAFAELVARSRALLRRPVLGTGRVLVSGDLQLDTRARTATRGGREISLTPREVDILEYLLRHKGRVVTREMLERDVWKQTRRFTSLNNVIDVQMMRLRRKLEEGGGGALIRTQRGVGYTLTDDLAG